MGAWIHACMGVGGRRGCIFQVVACEFQIVRKCIFVAYIYIITFDM